MATISDYVYENGLAVLDTEANRLDITSAEATTYAEASSTLSLGNYTPLSIGATQDRAGGGREVVVPAITAGSVTAVGTTTHYAIIDTINSRLLVTGSVTPNQAVTTGNLFALAEFSIGIPDPV